MLGSKSLIVCQVCGQVGRASDQRGRPLWLIFPPDVETCVQESELQQAKVEASDTSVQLSELKHVHEQVCRPCANHPLEVLQLCTNSSVISDNALAESRPRKAVLGKAYAMLWKS